MEANFVDLRRRSRDVIRALRRQESVTVLYRGKPAAIMQPAVKRQTPSPSRVAEHPAFGMWSKRKDMRDPAAFVRRLRRGRQHAL